MVLCDTNIFISAFNGRQDTIDQLDKIGLDEVILSAVTVMELFQGMGNKEELVQMKKKIKYYDVIQMDEDISAKAIELVETYKLSHGLAIPDAIIGATALVHQIPLYTYNLRDFDFFAWYHLVSTAVIRPSADGCVCEASQRIRKPTTYYELSKVIGFVNTLKPAFTVTNPRRLRNRS